MRTPQHSETMTTAIERRKKRNSEDNRTVIANSKDQCCYIGKGIPPPYRGQGGLYRVGLVYEKYMYHF
jgi:hypothetical protein